MSNVRNILHTCRAHRRDVITVREVKLALADARRRFVEGLEALGRRGGRRKIMYRGGNNVLTEGPFVAKDRGLM